MMSTLRRPGARLAAAGILILAALAMGRLGAGWAPAGDIAMAAAALISTVPIAAAALRALRTRTIGIDLLVSIASIGALAIGNYWEAAAVTFLFAFGHVLEQGAMTRTRSALTDLVDSAPQEAVLVRDGRTETVPTGRLRPDDVVLVSAGSSVPVDGTVVSGSGAADESAVTGESMPAEKTPGDQVRSGTTLTTGMIQVRAEKVGSQTLLARIVARVEEAQDARGRVQTMMDRFGRWYTPAIIVLAIVVGLASGSLTLALTLLVIGCPGALVISVPVAVVAGIGRGARDGILIRGGEHLETAAKVDTVVLDKTGTLTTGHPELKQVVPHGAGENSAGENGAGSEDEVLRWAALAEVGSGHPLADPIVDAARNRGVAPEGVPGEAEAIPGRGLTAEVGDPDRPETRHRVVVGTAELAGEELGSEHDAGWAASTSARLAADGATPVTVLRDGELLGVIAIADTIRADAPAALARLRRAGVGHLVMLSGDRSEVASAVAQQLGIDDARGGLLPEDKLSAVQELRAAGAVVAMVGDGVNDAPALAAADVGVAMGAAGSALAVETSDIALMADDLTRLPESLRLARRTRAVIRQNIVIAVATVTLLLAGVLVGGVTMALGMLVHEASVLVVIVNALRLLGRRARHDSSERTGQTGRQVQPWQTSEHGGSRSGRRGASPQQQTA
ncbi:heavy metal translocating P-type ATPase [Acidipropionibacterium virtanenii]|uniref:Zinc-transporting ATPase n=1 Tax=Acidipropionibacterium virtanenii TaxID=2057246 RepID=A0A344UY49_9ACTN|nr:cation-translocating P-type ATPase [Acidipropionibacterium virtanenii]AXE40197.1 Zinc-transporting ATPase [Acidipropionibacterium virtanenii]